MRFLVLIALVACQPDDNRPQRPSTMQIVAQGDALPPAALLSVGGTGGDDVWVVGADPGPGPVVLHWDGTAWETVDTGSPGDLWWVWPSPDDTVWMVGDGGRALQLDRSTGEVTTYAAAAKGIKLFGIWGSAEDDIYAVGGDITGASDGVIVHFDGSTWRQVATAPGTAEVPTRQAFKVWGSAADDVWVVGTGSLMMHFDGDSWKEVPTPLDSPIPLTTVHGAAPDLVWAVGGVGNAVALRFDGQTWIDESPPPESVVPTFNGVDVTASALVVGCGNRGAFYTRIVEGWQSLDLEGQEAEFLLHDFHACAWLGNGHWAVGGDLLALDEGFLAYDGPDEIAAP